MNVFLEGVGKYLKEFESNLFLKESEKFNGAILYCLLRYFKPKKIFNIGSESCEQIATEALKRNDLGQIITFKKDIKEITNEELRFIDDMDFYDFVFFNEPLDKEVFNEKIKKRIPKGVIVHFYDADVPIEGKKLIFSAQENKEEKKKLFPCLKEEEKDLYVKW